jgi:hypothetical protein
MRLECDKQQYGENRNAIAATKPIAGLLAFIRVGASGVERMQETGLRCSLLTDNVVLALNQPARVVPSRYVTEPHVSR